MKYFYSFFILIISVNVSAEIYECTYTDGTTNFSNKPCYGEFLVAEEELSRVKPSTAENYGISEVTKIYIDPNMHKIYDIKSRAQIAQRHCDKKVFKNRKFTNIFYEWRDKHLTKIKEFSNYLNDNDTMAYQVNLIEIQIKYERKINNSSNSEALSICNGLIKEMRCD